MKNTIKKIIKEYRNDLSEAGGYDDEDMMKIHYSGLMSNMTSSGDKIYGEYVKLVDKVLPEILDEDLGKELINNLEKLKDFLVSYDEFLEKTHNKNLKMFRKKGD
jgi:hypothetical protein